MSEQYTTYEQPATQPASPAKRRRWPHVVIPIVTLFVGVVIGAAGGSDTPGATAADTPNPAPSASGPAPKAAVEEEEPAEPTYDTPASTDFRLEVKTLSKECFGSAGCNLTYRILVHATRPTLSLDPSKTYELTYEVRGGEDGAQINTAEITGDESTVDQEEMLSTPSSKTVLEAVVTDISEQ
jgi:hypothetical protein